jgi:hypothetical protein
MRLSARSSPSRLFLLIVTAAALVPAVLTPLTPEVAATLSISRRLLDGAHLYRDAIDYAPPLIFLLGIPIEWIARLTSWPEWPIVVAAIAAISTLSLMMIRRLLDPGPLAWTALTGAVITMLAAVARDFGQAEHLVVILLLPFVVWCARLAAGGDENDTSPPPHAIRVAVGLLACTALALKPIVLIVYGVLLAYVVWSRRRVDILRAVEQRVVAIGFAIYLVGILVFAPAYVREVLPMASLHWWHGDPLGPMLIDWMVLSVPASSLILVAVGPWLTRDRAWGSLVRACALTSVAMFVVFVGQRDASPACFFPVRAFNALSAVLAAVGFARGVVMPSVSIAQSSSRSRLVMLVAQASLVTLAVVPPGLVWSMVAEVQTVDYANAQAGVRSPFVDPLIDVVRQRAAGKPIFVLSSSIRPAFPLVNLTEATWPYRFKSLLFVSIYYRDIDNPATAVYRPPEAQSASERAFFDQVVDELTQRPPSLLIVDVTRLKQGFGLTYFDFPTYYRQSPAFGALWQHYHLIAWKSNFQIFEYQPSR